MVKYWETKGTPVDPWTSYAVTPKALEECAKAQGVRFQRGDILLLRVGFIRKYYESTREERNQLADSEAHKLCAPFRPSPHSRPPPEPTPVARVSRLLTI